MMFILYIYIIYWLSEIWWQTYQISHVTWKHISLHVEAKSSLYTQEIVKKRRYGFKINIYLQAEK